MVSAIKNCKIHFIGAALFSALVNILYLTPTLYMMQIYDRVVPTGGITTLALISIAALLALSALAALDWLRTRILIRAGLELDQQLASDILSRAVNTGSNTQGAQALREFDNVRSGVSGPGALALFDAPWTPIYLGCCFLLHPAIGILTFAGGTVLATLAWLNERDARPRLRNAMNLANASYAAQEILVRQGEVVHALGMRKASIARHINARKSAIAAQAGAQFAGGRYTGAIKFFRLTLQSAALGLAAFLVVRGQMSPGAIIASSVLLSRAVSPIEQLVGSWPSLVQARSSWRNLLELFRKTENQEQPRTNLPPPVGRVSLENVSVRFEDSESAQLQNIILKIEPGQILGVIGASGAGKTTLARVLAGAIKPDSGVIRIDNSDYLARESDALARYIGYVPQSPSLFAGSVKDNISRFSSASGAPQAEVDRQAVSAAQAAGVHDMIQRLPKGYDTILGPYGDGLSAGQAQRIALARALFGDPVLLVLDEPNSSLDQDGEAALLTAVTSAAHRGACVVIIAHRTAALARVDRLLALREGAIQMEGPREEVLARLRSTRTTPSPERQTASAGGNHA